VVGTSGNLTGYTGGLTRKRFLLSLEELPVAEDGRLF
jgi:methylated-DNA-[protein]-cysteine S-methyltransferase